MRFATFLTLLSLLAMTAVSYAETPRLSNRIDLDALQAAKDALVSGTPTGTLRGAAGDDMSNPIWIDALP